ncbi:MULTISPECIES: pyruvate kinase [Gordonia]|uniref:pyruvate kinase n=1 Tax=Gordonia TaxID=2053 RepID=UPI0005EF5EC8|nr:MULTISPECIES: pyruvate kinase [Gordonia]KJR07083.1 pyruvate kinase [Gordonia sihwensis]KXT56264.1 pyruvate kinase [Gordonia sp. QH-12]MBY4570553.1 pyruvate kinase [Gordonia sihwensis]WFN91309.1 pyruvate kinase [Gordonia sihwensis]
MTRRTKIVCTLGPATNTLERITELVECGMDVARLNFSHGAHADHRSVYDNVRGASLATGKPVGILADLQGPKIRLGKFADNGRPNGAVDWNDGEQVRITVDDVIGDHDRVSTTYSQLAQDAEPGDRLLVDDGKVGLVVDRVDGNDVVCTVTEGGTVSNNKGLSMPGMKISVPALSEKDIADLEFALELGVDLIALSFVRSPADIELVREVMDRVGRRVPVVAKLEKPEAIENLEAVVLAFDAIMVARGDLGVEMPLEEVPLVQKRAIQMARENAKPVIVATQMLDSMIENSRPTRAEASDVANAVLDGADAVMLSGETSVGKYPFETVRTMSRIVSAVEGGTRDVPPLKHVPRTRRGIVTYAARDIAERLNATAIIAFTESGDTVRRVARLHSRVPLIAFTATEATHNQMAVSWGVDSYLVPRMQHTDDMIDQVDDVLTENGRLKKGDTVVIIAGAPASVIGSTNFVHVHRIGEQDH